MLGTVFFSNYFFTWSQCGFYIDFLIKKISEIFLRNYYVYTSQFFGEKYLVEYITKFFFNFIIFFCSKFLNYNNYYYNIFLYNIVAVILSSVFLFNLLVFFI